VAPRPYEIYVPCPETQVDAAAVAVDDIRVERDVLYVDARAEADYRAAHIEGAASFPYPILDDPPPERVAALKRRRGPVVTYGDGGRGDLGEMMASLLTELGVPEVSALEGGLPAWRERGGAIEGEAGAGTPVDAGPPADARPADAAPDGGAP
jgi:3-mercaptopyruvate sulfurtransferase SseA